MISWEEVTQKEFYETVGRLNVNPIAQGNWPYTSFFKHPDGRVAGKSVADNRGDKTYFVPVEND